MAGGGRRPGGAAAGRGEGASLGERARYWARQGEFELVVVAVFVVAYFLARYALWQVDYDKKYRGIFSDRPIWADNGGPNSWFNDF